MLGGPLSKKCTFLCNLSEDIPFAGWTGSPEAVRTAVSFVPFNVKGMVLPNPYPPKQLCQHSHFITVRLENVLQECQVSSQTNHIYVREAQ